MNAHAAALGLLLTLSIAAAPGSRAEEAAVTGTPAGAETAAYRCPPCETGCDDLVFAEAGTCHVCGMELIRITEMRRAAILVFDGVQIIDFTGPYEVFGQADFNVYTVAESTEPVTTAMGMTVTPRYDFEAAPAPTVLIVPGGGIGAARSSAETIAWLRRSAERAEHVLSVCNGAFLLAESGLLDGLRATTFYGLIDDLEEAAPHTEVVRDQRFVDNGKVITSAGLSSGIDASLHVISKYVGRGDARALALHLEYEWDPDSEFARASLADRQLTDVNALAGFDVELLDTFGDRERWTQVWRVRSERAPAQILAAVDERVAASEPWSRAEGSSPQAPRWTKTDAEGRSWEATASIAPEAEGVHRLIVRLERAALRATGSR